MIYFSELFVFVHFCFLRCWGLNPAPHICQASNSTTKLISQPLFFSETRSLLPSLCPRFVSSQDHSSVPLHLALTFFITNRSPVYNSSGSPLPVPLLLKHNPCSSESRTVLSQNCLWRNVVTSCVKAVFMLGVTLPGHIRTCAGCDIQTNSHIQ